MAKHYRVEVMMFGTYPRGSVLPAHAVLFAGPTPDLVARGVLAETHEPVNVELAPPPRPEPDAAGEMLAELRDLRGRAKTAGDLAALQEERADGLERKAKALERELAEKVAEIDRAAGMIDELRAENEKLRADLDELTAPAADAGKK